MTKLLLCLFCLVPPLFAQSLTPEEQKKLIEENKALKEEVKFLKSEIIKVKTSDATPQDSKKMMEVLQKGKRYQEEQNQALEELNKDD